MSKEIALTIKFSAKNRPIFTRNENTFELHELRGCVSQHYLKLRRQQTKTKHGKFEELGKSRENRARTDRNSFQRQQ